MAGYTVSQLKLHPQITDQRRDTREDVKKQKDKHMNEMRDQAEKTRKEPLSKSNSKYYQNITPSLVIQRQHNISISLWKEDMLIFRHNYLLDSV